MRLVDGSERFSAHADRQAAVSRIRYRRQHTRQLPTDPLLCSLIHTAAGPVRPGPPRPLPTLLQPPNSWHSTPFLMSSISQMLGARLAIRRCVSRGSAASSCTAAGGGGGGRRSRAGGQGGRQERSEARGSQWGCAVVGSHVQMKPRPCTRLGKESSPHRVWQIQKSP